MELDQAAAGCPWHHRFIGEQFRFPPFNGAGEGNPGSDFMSAGTGLPVNFFM